MIENETIEINENFFNIISCIDERFKILDYLINHRSGQYAIGTIKSISENTGLSTGCVQKFLKILETKEIIERKGNGVFILPKAILPIINE